MNQHSHEVRLGRSDTLGEMDLYDASRIRRMITMGDANASRQNATASPARYTGAAIVGADDQERLATSLRMREHFSNPPSAYKTRRARDTAGLGDMYTNEEISARSAQVRDALFGTVAGELPGLEIVREQEREWAEEDNDKEK